MEESRVMIALLFSRAARERVEKRTKQKEAPSYAIPPT
jgi:hypothetical protein